MKAHNIKKQVRENYAKIAKDEASCCQTGAAVCGDANLAESVSSKIGYSQEQMESVPDGANLGLGCGNPVAIASLREGEVVLDLGSGAGFDCFLAARKVGERGKVIGVDMTPEMVEKARLNAEKGNYKNVEFRLGEIENLPAADNLVDAVISNCVINLSLDKSRVFQEAFRVLKPGGRMMVSDIVVSKTLPASIRESVAAYVGCLSGAMVKAEYLHTIEAAGFQDVKVISETAFPFVALLNDPTAQAVIEANNLSDEEVREAGGSIISITVNALKTEQ